jgi:hypothetical protein
MYNGLTSREGFTADVLARWIGKTVLNPALVLPIILAARYTKKGEDMSILHHKAYSRIRTLFYMGILRWLTNWQSRRAANNFVSDSYNWPSEVAIVTGGSGGIGGHIARLLAEEGLTVVVLDIQPLTYSAPSNIHFYICDLTSPSTLSQVANRIRKEIGQPTILINNAGVARGKTLLDATEKGNPLHLRRKHPRAFLDDPGIPPLHDPAQSRHGGDSRLVRQLAQRSQHGRLRLLQGRRTILP